VDLALAVGGAGALGAVARYLADGAVQERTGGLFPLGTLVVNLVGSLVLGVLAGLALTHAGTAAARTVIGAGFCGGLTTWSTASWETVRLAQDGEWAAAVQFTVANLAGSMLAAAAGLAVVLG
jgi:CrcB protein